MSIFISIWIYLKYFFKSHHYNAYTVAILNQQLDAYKRRKEKPKLTESDRLLWIILKWCDSKWKNLLRFVKPATVNEWNKKRFKKFWRLLSKRKSPGAPTIDWELIKLIRKIKKRNPLWKAPIISRVLKWLGYDVDPKTVRKYIKGYSDDPSWKYYIESILKDTHSFDFFVVRSINYSLYYCFILIDNQTTKVLHSNVTQKLNSAWVCQQLREAYPYSEGVPKNFLHDNDPMFTSGELTNFIKKQLKF